MSPANAINYRQRFTLWKDNIEVPGGPYFRDVAAERAAEKILADEPDANLRIDREVKETIEHAGDVAPSQVWRNVGTVWSNPAARG